MTIAKKKTIELNKFYSQVLYTVFFNYFFIFISELHIYFLS